MLCCNAKCAFAITSAALKSNKAFGLGHGVPSFPGSSRRASVRQLARSSTMVVSSSSVQDPNVWKSNVPYISPSKDEEFQIKYVAACMCGRVEYAVDSEPVAAKFCHCTSCQTLHGKCEG